MPRGWASCLLSSPQPPDAVPSQCQAKNHAPGHRQGPSPGLVLLGLCVTSHQPPRRPFCPAQSTQAMGFPPRWWICGLPCLLSTWRMLTPSWGPACCQIYSLFSQSSVYCEPSDCQAGGAHVACCSSRPSCCTAPHHALRLLSCLACGQVCVTSMVVVSLSPAFPSCPVDCTCSVPHLSILHSDGKVTEPVLWLVF